MNLENFQITAGKSTAETVATKILLREITVIPVEFTAKRIEELEELIDTGFENIDLAPIEKNKCCVIVLPPESVDINDQIDFFDVNCMVPAENFRKDIETPNKPYFLVFELSSDTNISPKDAKDALKDKSRCISVEEGLAIAFQRPELLSERSIDLIGSQYNTECTPTIYKWGGERRISAICSDVADPMCGPSYALRRKPIE